MTSLVIVAAAPSRSARPPGSPTALLDMFPLPLVKFSIETKETLESSSVNVAVHDSRPNCAARFGLVGTVTEPAAQSSESDFRKRQIETFICIPQANTSKTRGIEQHASIGQGHEVARRCRVAPFMVAGPYGSDRLHVRAD